MIGMFLLGSLGTLVGVLSAHELMDGSTNIGNLHHAIAGMITGTYTGGSINFNAIALHYQVNETGNLYTGTVVIDNVMTAFWIVLTLMIPALLRKKGSKPTTSQKDATQTENFGEKESLEVWSLGVVIFIGLVAMISSDFLSETLGSAGINIPSILILTTIALVLAQFRWIQKLSGSKVIGLFLIYLFLSVIGAYCDLDAMFSMGSLALILRRILQI